MKIILKANSFTGVIEKVIIVGWLIIAFIIPFWQKAIPPLLIGLAALTVVLAGLEKNWGYIKIRSAKFKLIFFVFIAFYLWHVVGLLWTKNFEYAYSDLIQKSALVLLPVYFLWRGEQKPRTIDLLLLAFIFGNFISGIYDIYVSIKMSFEFGWSIDYFLENNLSTLLHKSYYSLYLNFAWFGALYLIERRSENLDISIRIFLKIFIPFAWILILLLGSRAVFIFCGIFGTLIFVNDLLNFKKNTTRLVLITIALISMAITVYFLPSVHDDFKSLYDKTIVENIDVNEEESTTARLLVLKSSLDLIKDNYLIGVGTGDVKDELLAQYSKKGYLRILVTQLNAHNQFLQAFIALGIIGFCLLILAMFMILKIAYKSKHELLLCFGIIMILCFMTESALEVQTGISFYTFWGSILLLSVPENYLTKSQNEGILFGRSSSCLRQ